MSSLNNSKTTSRFSNIILIIFFLIVSIVLFGFEWSIDVPAFILFIILIILFVISLGIDIICKDDFSGKVFPMMLIAGIAGALLANLSHIF